ncbi:hypothetical protein TIFTF001_012361 [Ficus carica]|uniref:Uncharacterized protein n=1 Tax=Ficus carica TaxID=3494 RepID=A0AA87ZTA7_FICCA|nr:hypothetical protein TIFTF001_012361 [Ficus carica]
MGPPENPDPTGKPQAGPVAVGRDVEADIQAAGVGSAADDGSEGAELGQTRVGLRAVGSGPGREQGNGGPEGSPGGRAAEGGGGGVRVSAPGRHNHPLPVLRVRAGPDPDRRRLRWPEADVEAPLLIYGCVVPLPPFPLWLIDDDDNDV